ncbi:uncharacterized protein BcabD6B2_24200 [Babesia caballi]|uniref:Uncharacterized protein n=1 Tax=Babesia caballi TaxID=5871 RepID=A0AAV4LTR8_BABCB|nr:hypothetical protein, conserved [Babesia caballi]
MQQCPQLLKVVMQRSSTQQQLVIGHELPKLHEPLGVSVLQLVCLVNHHQLPRDSPQKVQVQWSVDNGRRGDAHVAPVPFALPLNVYLGKLIRANDLACLGITVVAHNVGLRQPALKLPHPVVDGGLGHDNQVWPDEPFPIQEVPNQRDCLDCFPQTHFVCQQHAEPALHPVDNPVHTDELVIPELARIVVSQERWRLVVGFKLGETERVCIPRHLLRRFPAYAILPLVVALYKVAEAVVRHNLLLLVRALVIGTASPLDHVIGHVLLIIHIMGHNPLSLERVIVDSPLQFRVDVLVLNLVRRHVESSVFALLKLLDVVVKPLDSSILLEVFVDVPRIVNMRVALPLDEVLGDALLVETVINHPVDSTLEFLLGVLPPFFGILVVIRVIVLLTAPRIMLHLRIVHPPLPVAQGH